MKIPILSDIVESIINIIDKDIHIREIEYMGVIARDITLRSSKKDTTKVKLTE